MREKEETLLWIIALDLSNCIVAQDEKMSSCGNSEFVMRNAELRKAPQDVYSLLPTASPYSPIFLVNLSNNSLTKQKESVIIIYKG